MKKRILIVDDEPDALELISVNLAGAGFQVQTAENGEQALERVRTFPPDLIVLDLMLPEMGGLDVCKVLRNHPATRRLPIVLVTAKATEIDRVLGFELGADDYVTKPFSPRELVLRVQALLRRADEPKEAADVFRAGCLQIDSTRHQVQVKDKPVSLTATEFKLLALLAKKQGRVLSRDQLLRDVWEYDAVIDTRTVDTHMRRLREKLGPAAKYLDTVRGIGYRFMEI